MKNLKEQSKPRQRASRAKFYKLQQLIELAQSKGFTLEYDPSFKVFKLTCNDTPALWGWIVHPHSDLKVTHVRTLDKEGWGVVLDSNIERILS